ncbi:MAG: hypothetical protein BWY82_01783 [Verrucomicrobia bacterium ADurb.Bin474]|nr:MAG: hypothetical protein BWY82_01783 [Verrucomicrobia bacterium ADurb.Bin474]
MTGKVDVDIRFLFEYDGVGDDVEGGLEANAYAHNSRASDVGGFVGSGVERDVIDVELVRVGFGVFGKGVPYPFSAGFGHVPVGDISEGLGGESQVGVHSGMLAFRRGRRRSHRRCWLEVLHRASSIDPS